MLSQLRRRCGSVSSSGRFRKSAARALHSDGEVRTILDEASEEPDGAIVTLAAILNAYPNARVRVEVIERNPQMNEPRDRATDGADALARAIVSAGVDATRVTHAGIKSRNVDAPTVELVVVAK